MGNTKNNRMYNNQEDTMSLKGKQELQAWVSNVMVSPIRSGQLKGFLAMVALVLHEHPEALRGLILGSKDDLYRLAESTALDNQRNYLKTMKDLGRISKHPNTDTYLLESVLYDVKTTPEKLDDVMYRELLRILVECTPLEVLDVALNEEWVHKLETGSTTPTYINQLMVELGDVQVGQTILDPTMGVAGTLLAAYKKNEMTLVGQDINLRTVGCAYINLFLHGVKLEHIALYEGEMFREPHFLAANVTFDRVLQFPNFATKINTESLQGQVSRFPFGPMAPMAGEWMNISSALTALTPHDGKAVIAVFNGVLYRGGADGKIRESILNYDLIETVIGVPSGILPNISIPWAIVVCNNHKQDVMKGKVQFIQISEDMIETASRRTQVLTKDSIRRIVEIYRNKEEVPGVAITVPLSELKEGKLLTSDYIEEVEVELDSFAISINTDELEKRETIPLDKVVSIGRGFNITAKSENANGEYGVLRIMDIEDYGRINYDNLVKTTSEAGKVDNYRLEKDDLVLSIRGGTNKVGMIDRDMDKLLFNANLVRLRVKHRQFNPKWLQIYLTSLIGQWLLKRISRGTTVQQITVSELKELPIPVLSLEEQERDVAWYEQKLEELEQLRLTLRQQEQAMKRELVDSFGFGEGFVVRE